MGYVQKTVSLVMPISMSDDNMLRIEIIPQGAFSAMDAGRLSIDQNARQVSGGTDSDGNIVPLAADNVRDFPCIRVELT